jgi:methionine-rich copper-binding protein CopC
MAYRRAGLLLAAVLTLLVATALPAAAHNELKSSNPAAGASVDTPPQQIVLTFSEDLIPGKTTVTVTGPDGANAASGQTTLDGPVATVPISAAHAGVYTVAYKVVADDGDVTDTKFTFTLALTAVTTTTVPTTTTTVPTTTTAPPTTSAAPANTAASSDSGSNWWIWLVVALAVILIAVVLLILRRRRTSSS